MSDNCCSPKSNREDAKNNNFINKSFSKNFNETKFANIDGGWFLMGSEESYAFPGDGEGPVRKIYVDKFSISKYSVTISEFKRFIDDTNYITDAERFGWSFVFFEQLKNNSFSESVQNAPWWIKVENAYWNLPDGENVGIEKFSEHPVTHISWRDAQEYCKWSGTRLPTEAEWEFAARGGLDQKKYPWGDDLEIDGEVQCNIFDGEFPNKNNAPKDMRFTTKVDAFHPNKFGLYNMVGNVWEWTQDWFTRFHDPEINVNPTGPEKGNNKVIRGGSFLCHDSYCNRYRTSSRTSNSIDSSTSNMGFRIVKN